MPDVDEVKFESPEYCAVMLCLPAERVVVANCATPLASVAVEIWKPPSRNATVPVGVPDPDAAAT